MSNYCRLECGCAPSHVHSFDRLDQILCEACHNVTSPWKIHSNLALPFPPTPLDISRPNATLRSILDTIAVVANREVVSIEQVWRRVDAWISFLVKAFIRQGLATTPEGIDFQDRLITVCSFLLTSCLEEFPPRGANHLYPFFALMFELAVCIADTGHPCFGILWEEVSIALNVTNSQAHRPLANSIARVASDYDIGALCIRRLVAIVNAWSDIDIATVHSSISFLAFCDYHISGIHERLLSLHGIRWVALVMSHTASKRHPFSPGCLRLNELLSKCASFLGDNIIGNPAAICEALDGHLLIALAKLDQNNEFCIYDLCVNFANLARHVESGIFARSVLHRVLRGWKVVRRRGLLQSSSSSSTSLEEEEEEEEECVLYEALQTLHVEARKMKESMRTFDAMKVPRDQRCSNNMCPARTRAEPPKESVKLRRCSGCKLAFYCSKECQKTHWKSVHREKCHHFKDRKCDRHRGVTDLDTAFLLHLNELGLYDKIDILTPFLLGRNTDRFCQC